MRLIDESKLLPLLQERLAGSEEVSVAIAWIRCGHPLDALLRFATRCPGKLRVICGVNGFLTEPKALLDLGRVARLKIAYGTAGTKFHTKLFLFSSAVGTVFWVGSANLTESAFSSNRELVCEIPDEGSAALAFENYWAEFSEPDEDWLIQYEVLYTQAAKPSDPFRHLDAPKIKAPVSDAWIEYVTRLKAKNEKRLEWIARQLPEVTAIGGGDWQQLTKDDAQKLLGIAKGYGGLGRLIGAGVVKNIFYEASWKNLKTRQSIANALGVIPPDPGVPAFEPMLTRAFELITNLDRVNVGTVTRLLAVRHPDRFVSVNGASIAGLAKLSGMSQKELGTAKGYAALIRWVMNQTWWNCADPEDDTSLYWRHRAALLDIIAYSGDPEKGTEAERDYDPQYE